MLIHITLVTEILATIMCIHCIHGSKICLDVKTIGVIIEILIILELINYYHINGIFSLIIYVILFAFCKIKFKCNFFENLVTLILCMILLTCIQFLCFCLVGNFTINVRNVLGNMLLLAVCCVILPKCGLHRLAQGICRKSKFVLLVLGFACPIIVFMILSEKIFYILSVQQFILVVPAIILLLYSFLKWYIEHIEVERKVEEMQNVRESTDAYRNLLTNVRLRQHEFKNHIAAILATHYTCKTYEKLIQEQEKYCAKMIADNKYNSLLSIEDGVLAGYLYMKFQEIDKDEIEVIYKIETKVNQCRVPVYNIIEMLGILLDNAVEAVKYSENKKIDFVICEVEEGCCFLVRNPYRIAAYDEIIAWFQLEKSEKGRGRGLGLYHLRCLCAEWQCNVGCRNVEINEENWIEFSLIIGKADNM